MQQQPSALEATMNLAQHYMDLERYEKALDYLREALAIDPTVSRLYFMSANACYMLSRYKEAEHHLQNCITYHYSLEHVNSLLGKVYFQQNRPVEAEQAYLAALRENPNNVWVHAEYAYLMLHLGFKEKAHKLLLAGSAIDPNNSRLLQIRHMLKLSGSKEAEQLMALEQYMQYAPSEIARLVQAGLHEVYNNRDHEAYELFRQAYILNPINKDLEERLEEVAIRLHPWFKPMIWIDRMGGPGVLWVGFAMIVIMAKWLEMNTFGIIFLVLYFVLVIYSWTIGPIVKRMIRSR